MSPSAPRLHRSISLVAIAACSAKDPPPPPPPTATATPVEVDPPASNGHPKINVTFHKLQAPGSELGKRCTVAGEPLAPACTSRGAVALDPAGTLWTVSGKQVRRLKGDGCAYADAGAPVDLPADNPRPQALGKGKVYMRSGGAEWHLLADGNKVYAYDFLGGMFRIDSGNAEPFCLDVFGYDSAAVVGGKLLVAREGVEELHPGRDAKAKCTATSAKLDDKFRGKLAVVGGKLIGANRDDQVAGFDGTAIQTDKLCSVNALFACGDNTCAVDGNCRAIVQSDPPRKLDFDALFAPVPWSIGAVATKPDGTAIVGAVLRDGQGDAATCEGALFELPGAVFHR